MPNNLRSLLEALRDHFINADSETYFGYGEKIEEALRIVGWKNAMRVGLEMVERQLSYFQSHHPTVNWPREALQRISQAVENNERIDQWLSIPENAIDFLEPGLNSFVTAIDDLWDAAREVRYPYSESVYHAVVGAIASEANEYWGNRHPEKWYKWMNWAEQVRRRINDAVSGEGAPLSDSEAEELEIRPSDVPNIGMEMLQDSDTFGLERTLWLEFLTLLERVAPNVE